MIDFREIPQAHIASGDQDSFELFARDFLEALGFCIVEGPGRGADRGRDLIVAETIGGTISRTEKLWMVSVKHKAHSGRSITDVDEIDPIGRVRKFKCQGFMGIYSTLPSSGLDDTFARIRDEIDVFIFDRSKIERYILTTPALQTTYQIYFPTSYRKWNEQKKDAVEVWGEVEPLNCCYCGKDILLEDLAIMVIVRDRDTLSSELGRRITDVYWYCKGKCDARLTQSLPPNRTNGWQDLSDLRIPLVFMRWVCAFTNRIRRGIDIYEDEAYLKHLEFILAMSQTVMKHTNEEQRARIKQLQLIPGYMGGIGD